ncbi:serpin B5 [Pleurodeles waltl]
MATLLQANINVALDIYKKIIEQDKKANIIFSPICISASLALASKGAKNDTETKMKTVLHIENAKDVDFGYQSIASELAKISESNSLKLIKRLYVDKSLNCTKEFINSSKKPYPSQLEIVDFKEHPKETREQINKNISELTNGKIETILCEDNATDQTKLLLLGAAICSGKWLKKFDKTKTKEVPFRISKTESKPVQMMQLEARCFMGYVKELKTLVLDLPCENKAMSMIILLPQDIEDDSTGLEQLEKELTYEKFVHWTNPSMMANTKVNVSLPKFKVFRRYDLKSLLTSLGLGDIFNEEVADFSGMTETKGVALSQAIHEASLEISEDGLEEPDMARERVLMHKDEFNGDHPFLMAVRHNKSRSILMLGKFCSP